LNYADQRYYNATDGRFNTPDRYMALAGGTNDPSTPLSWNRYAYVAGDPANWREPTGQIMCVSLCGSDGGDGGGSGGGAGVGGGRSGPRPYQGLDPGSAPGGVAYEKMSDSLEAKELQDAFDLAEKILATTNCGSIYNSSVSGVQPDEELRELYTTNAFNSANLPGANASTALVYPSPGVVQNPSLEITLNNNLFGGWNNETPAQRAGTLLHELGHVYVLLWGSNASSIVTDAGNQSASNQNKATIAINCPGAS